MMPVLDTIVQNMPLPFVCLQPVWRQGQIVDLIVCQQNSAFRATFGNEAEETVRDCLFLGSSDSFFRHFEQALAGKTASFSQRLAKKGRWIEITLFPVCEQRVGAVLRDISQQKQSEAQLREREERLRVIFQAASNVAFIITDMHPQTPRVLEFSPGAEKIFGYSRQEMIGQP